MSERIARDAAQSADVGEALLWLARTEHAAGNEGQAAQSAKRAAASLANGLGIDHELTLAARDPPTSPPRRLAASTDEEPPGNGGTAAATR